MKDKKRIISIDILRGLNIIFMLIINLNPNEELSFPFLVHTEWNGLNFSDCVFCFFLFLSGVVLALQSNKIFGDEWFKKVLKRGLLLVLLGIIYNHFVNIVKLIFDTAYNFDIFLYDLIHYFRPFGVLQRIGIAYIFGAITYHFVRSKTKLFFIALLILLGTTLGYYLYKFANPFDMNDNISSFIDCILQGREHNYMQKVCDPEGMYGNINAIANFILAIIAGSLLKERKYMNMVAIGTLISILGLLWSCFDIISKPIWSASYVLILTGIFFIIISSFDYVIKSMDIKTDKFSLLQFIGRNTLFFYIPAGILEAILNNLMCGSINLYNYIWRATIYNEKYVQISCLFFSIIIIMNLILIVTICIKRIKFFKLR